MSDLLCRDCGGDVPSFISRKNCGSLCQRCINRYSILDSSKTVTLSPGLVVEYWVRSDGLTDVNVVDQSVDDRSPDGRQSWPEHEKTGALPPDIQARVRRAHCGRMTRSGKPCRNGPWCKYHR